MHWLMKSGSGNSIRVLILINALQCLFLESAAMREAGSAEQTTEKLLRWRFAPNQQLDYDIVRTRHERVVDCPSNERQEFRRRAEIMDVRWNVRHIVDDQTAQIDVEHTRVRLSGRSEYLSLPFKEPELATSLTYDSKTRISTSRVDEQWREAEGKRMIKAIDALKEPLSLYIVSGKMHRARFSENQLDAMTREMPGLVNYNILMEGSAPEWALFGAYFYSELGFQGAPSNRDDFNSDLRLDFERFVSLPLLPLPAKPVKIGDQWQDSLTRKGQRNEIGAVITYTYVGSASVGAQRFDRIEIRADIHTKDSFA